MLYRLLDFYYDYYRGNYVANAKNKNKVTEPYFRVYFSFLLSLPLFGFFAVCSFVVAPRGPKDFESVLCEIF